MRMERSAKIFLMEIPYSVDELVEATHELISRNRLGACYVRPIAFRGLGEMGVNPENNPVDVIVAVWRWGTYLGEEALTKGCLLYTSDAADDLHCVDLGMR